MLISNLELRLRVLKVILKISFISTYHGESNGLTIYDRSLFVVTMRRCVIKNYNLIVDVERRNLFTRDLVLIV